jgi:hypothetical protein
MKKVIGDTLNNQIAGRCKDCKHRVRQMFSDKSASWYMCHKFDFMFNGDGMKITSNFYCAFFKKKC